MPHSSVQRNQNFGGISCLRLRGRLSSITKIMLRQIHVKCNLRLYRLEKLPTYQIEISIPGTVYFYYSFSFPQCCTSCSDNKMTQISRSCSVLYSNEGNIVVFSNIIVCSLILPNYVELLRISNLQIYRQQNLQLHIRKFLNFTSSEPILVAHIL
jgi:hypothetical protein